MATHPADSRGLRLTARPPGADEPVRVYDVLVVTTSEAGAFEEFQAHPPAGDPPAELGRGLSIQQLASDVAELVMNACELRGHYYFAQRQYGCRYAFVLEQPLSEAHTFRWDPEEVIRDALVLSRLVRDNDHSTEYSARVTEYESGELRVMPHDGGESRYVYRMLNERDWMDAAEARTLAGLLAAFWSTGRLPRRLERTLWASEHVAWERYLDVILPTLVAALEGMLNTSARQVVRQFTTRVPALADELGVPDVSKRLCRRMYDARSQGAHGTDIDLLKPEARRDETVRQLSRLQTVLRGALRRGIEDPAFRTAFDLTPGGEATYVMTGPDGGTRGAWHVTAVDPPTSLEFTDAFADQDGTRIADMPVHMVRVRLTERDGGTRMEMHLTFESREDIEKLLSTGIVEGLRQAVGQIDGLLA